MEWLPCLGEFSNHFCFDYVGPLIMNHKYIGNDFFGLSVPDDRRVDHKITEEEIIFCDQAEKLLYTTMKKSFQHLLMVSRSSYTLCLP